MPKDRLKKRKTNRSLLTLYLMYTWEIIKERVTPKDSLEFRLKCHLQKKIEEYREGKL